MGAGGKAIVSQPTCMSVGSSTQQIYKPVTITTQQPGQTTLGLGSVAGIRTSINTTALVPTPLSVGTLPCIRSRIIGFFYDVDTFK